MLSAERFFGLAIIRLSGKLCGEGVERLGQTAVLGDLLPCGAIGPGLPGLVHLNSFRLAGFPCGSTMAL